jgi:hypothetical protein
MYKNGKWLLICLALLTTCTILEAKTVNHSTLKTGLWEITYYQSPSENTASSLTSICVNKDHTWSLGLTTTPDPQPTIVGGIPVTIGGIIIPGNGGWNQEGNKIQFYGTVGEAIQGGAFSAFGDLIGNKLITGRYVHFNIGGIWPNGDGGVFKASFQRNHC